MRKIDTSFVFFTDSFINARVSLQLKVASRFLSTIKAEEEEESSDLLL
jgi:hypothetical protein